MKRKVLAVVLSVCMLLGFTACGGSASGTGTTAAAPAATAAATTKAAVTTAAGTSAAAATSAAAKTATDSKGRKFGMLFAIVHPFFQPIGESAQAYAKSKGWTVDVNAPDSSNAQKQIEMMENMISMHVDGIAIGPTDSKALAATIDKAVDAGIKVITLETDCADSKRTGYLGTDNYKAGRHMGYVVGDNLGGKGNVMILTGLPTQESLNLRIKGIKDVLAEKYPGIKLVDTQSSEGDASKAVSATENMIQAHPDFSAIIGIDATAGPAMITVWKAKGWQNSTEHKIITFDDMPDNLQGMRDGYISDIVAQRESSWGKTALDMLNDLCDGKTIPEITDTGSVEITPKNIDTFTQEESWIEK